MADFDEISGSSEITVLTTDDRIPIKRTTASIGHKTRWIKGVNIGSGGSLAAGISTADSLTFNPGTPVSNAVVRANAGAGTYVNFLSGPGSQITVDSSDGQVDFIFSTITGYWTKVTSPQDLTNYTIKSDFNLVKVKTDQLFNSDALGFEVHDGNGNVGLIVDSDGAKSKAFIAQKFIREDGTDIAVTAGSIDETKGVNYVDENNNPGLQINENAVLQVSKLREVNAAISHVWGKPADYLVIETTGQSNSIGENAFPIISTSQAYDSLMLRSGSWTDDFTNGSFAPLIEGGFGRGETPLSGWCESIITEIRNKRFIPYDKKGFQLVGVATGIGGLNISQLSKGTESYTKGLNALKNVVAIAAAENKTVAIAASAWIQGEGNTDIATPTDDYVALAKQLFTDRNTDYKAITEQPFDICFFGYQIAWGWQPSIATAHYKMHQQIPNFCIATPSYHFLYHSTDHIHIMADSVKWMAQYFGIAYRRMLLDGNKNTIAEPVQFKLSGNIITIKVKAPSLPLAIDTTQVPIMSEGYGFRVFDNTGTKLTITTSNVQVDGDTITITCPSNPGTGGVVTYAVGGNNIAFDADSEFLGNRGNIRDSQGDTMTWGSKRLDNWLIRFEKSI